MNNLLAHAHLVLAHFPIVLSLVGALFYLLQFKYKQLNTAALILLILSGIIVLFVPFTGEEAQQLLRTSNVEIARDAMMTHREAGEMARNIMVITAILAAFELYRPPLWHTYRTIFVSILSILCILSATALARTGYTGGKIRHTELNTTA